MTREIKAIYGGPAKPLEEIQNDISAVLVRLARKSSQAPTPLVHDRFILVGDHWAVTFKGQTKIFKNSKGIRYIEHLLRNQGEQLHVRDLFDAVNPPNRDSSAIHPDLSGERLKELGLSVSDLGDAGEVMDAAGIVMMKRHLKELNHRIDEARALGDEDEQARLEDEQEQWLKYLGAALGGDGHPRKASSTVERLRKSVTKRIRTDINRFKSAFPELGHHLDCIKTGTFCQYAPHPEVKWRFDSL